MGPQVIAGSPAECAVALDLGSARFRAGVIRDQWHQELYLFPVLVIVVAALEPSGSKGEYSFRFELSGFPGAAPEVRIWDRNSNRALVHDRRPKGSARVVEAFKPWGPDTVYRPWERHSGAHNGWASKYPKLAWHPKRDLAFILEDLHGLLTSNASSVGARPAT
jgi:hypothetical protein